MSTYLAMTINKADENELTYLTAGRYARLNRASSS